jgi:membrane associated rhomboid family serine protease
MFFPVPVGLRDGREFHAIPVVNGLLVVINVLIFWLGWHPVVGPGTGLLSILTYAFGHANLYHLVGNMWALLVFGTDFKISRRANGSRLNSREKST